MLIHLSLGSPIVVALRIIETKWGENENTMPASLKTERGLQFFSFSFSFSFVVNPTLISKCQTETMNLNE